MESPSTWDLLTAALAVVGLDDAARAWDFLVDIGAMGNREEVRRRFLAIASEERARGPVTGPSEAARVAHRVVSGRGYTLRAFERDPNGARARELQADFIARAPAPVPPIPRPFDAVHCQHCGNDAPISTLGVAPCETCGREPVDALTLLIELGCSSATARICPRCASADTFHRYCWYCGEQLDDLGS